MRITVYSTRSYDRHALEAANAGAGHQLDFRTESLDERTALLARGSEAVCAFVNDRLDAATLASLRVAGVRLVALRCTGRDHVDAGAAARLGITVMRAPAYSPHAVAEHAMALLMALNRRLVRAAARIHRQDFTLDGLVGTDLHGKSVGVVGTGRIGTCMARILRGFGCHVLATDPVPLAECRGIGVRYVPLVELLDRCDAVTLHCPLTHDTRHLIDGAALARMRHGAILVNTSRGAVLDTRAAIESLKKGHLGALGIDVYEGEAPLFFRDLSDGIVADDVFARLLAFPNVLVTAHQGFLTHEALRGIAEATIRNVTSFEHGEPIPEATVVPELAAVA
jgi:D-lactate dehydrogenase